VTGSVVALASIILLSRATTRRTFSERARRNTFLWMLLALFACSLLPVINLRINVFDTQGERFLYLPSVFAAIGLAYILMRLVPQKTAWLLLTCVLLCYMVSLWKTNQIWSEAAQLSKAVLNQIVRLSTHDEILILNAPDNLRGAHLYRNGLDQALKTFQSTKKIRSTRMIAFHRVLEHQDEIKLEKEEGELVLHPANQKIEFEQINDAPECVKITERSRSVLRLRFDECAKEKFDVFYFSAGRMRKVGNQ
jgi:uncharacterized membrane protein YhaH (DUF805 family)